MKLIGNTAFILMCSLALHGAFAPSASAASARELDVRVDEALEKFGTKVSGAEDVLSKARGVLVLPGVWKGGFGVGAEYGEGALLVNGAVQEYYSVVGGSFGFQLGLQKHTLILCFMNDEVLNRFVSSDGWEFGVDGSAVLVEIGVDGRIDSVSHNEPILVFALDPKGLMYNLNIEGYKFTKIKK